MSNAAAGYREARARYLLQCGPIFCLECNPEVPPGVCSPALGSSDALGVCTTGLGPTP